MTVVTVRNALRVLRVERLRGVRRVAGLNASSVHRIENTKKYPRHIPKLDSLLEIVAACQTSLGAFFTTLERGAHASGEARVSTILEALEDERTVEQMLGFLALPEPAREAVRLHQAHTSLPSSGRDLVSTSAPTLAAHTKSPVRPHRSSARRKTGT